MPPKTEDRCIFLAVFPPSYPALVQFPTSSTYSNQNKQFEISANWHARLNRFFFSSLACKYPGTHFPGLGYARRTTRFYKFRIHRTEEKKNDVVPIQSTVALWLQQELHFSSERLEIAEQTTPSLLFRCGQAEFEFQCALSS